MTGADLAMLVAAAPGTAVLSAFLIGVVAAGVAAGLAWWSHGHDDRCASCAGGFLDDAEFRKIGDATGVISGE